jgi:hypothetical protein
MKKSFLLLLCLGLTGCVLDRGRCLHSHHVHEDARVVVLPEYNIALKVTLPVTHVYPERDYDVCDRWEFPQGKK